MLTECSMSDNVAVVYPEIEFVRPRNLCPRIKRTTLANHPRVPAAARAGGRAAG